MWRGKLSRVLRLRFLFSIGIGDAAGEEAGCFLLHERVSTFNSSSSRIPVREVVEHIELMCHASF